jgi:hypothetical protein
MRRLAPSGVCLLAILAILGGAGSAAADEPAAAVSASAKEEARLHFTAGVNLLQDPENPRYEEAYAEFKRAYELAKSPSILGNMGLCALKLERDAEALEAYTRYLAEVPDLDAAERAQTERDIVTLRAGIAKITVESNPDGAMIQDTRVTGKGESVVNIYGPVHGKTELGLRRGHHVIKARFGEGREVAWEINLTGGESHVFERPAVVDSPVQPEKRAPGTTHRPVPTSVYVGGIATGALAVGAIVTGVLALGAGSRFDDANNGTDSSKANDLRSSAQTLNVVSDVFIGLTLVGAVVTTYLYLSRPSVTTRSDAALMSPNWISF